MLTMDNSRPRLLAFFQQERVHLNSSQAESLTYAIVTGAIRV